MVEKRGFVIGQYCRQRKLKTASPWEALQEGGLESTRRGNKTCLGGKRERQQRSGLPWVSLLRATNESINMTLKIAPRGGVGVVDR